MLKRQPLPAEVEAALNVLTETEDVAAIDAAKEGADAHFVQHQWLDWLVFTPFLPLIILVGFRNQPWFDVMFHSTCGLSLLAAFVIHRQYKVWSVDRYKTAINRWQLVTGKLATARKRR